MQYNALYETLTDLYYFLVPPKSKIICKLHQSYRRYTNVKLMLQISWLCPVGVLIWEWSVTKWATPPVQYSWRRIHMCDTPHISWARGKDHLFTRLMPAPLPKRLHILLHNNLLIQLWPSSCWSAHRMGIYSNPLINGLIHHTFKINFVLKNAKAI